MLENDSFIKLKERQYFFCPECRVNYYLKLEQGIEIACFSSCAALSGCLYSGVLFTLIRVRQAKRSKTLTLVLILLWVSWCVCMIPYIIFNAYFQWSEKFWYEMPTDAVYSLYDYWSDYYKIVIGDVTTRALKHSYSSINSLLLIIMLRPFNEPLKFLWRKINVVNCCRKLQ